jgi:hypothetical protein
MGTLIHTSIQKEHFYGVIVFIELLKIIIPERRRRRKHSFQPPEPAMYMKWEIKKI